MEVQVKILLREKRNQFNISIRELAKISGVSKNYISNIELGQSIPTIKILCKIAKAMEIPIQDLLYYK